MTKRTFAVARRERAGAALDAGRGPKVPRGRKGAGSGKPDSTGPNRGRKRKRGRR
ncbi:MAG: hypothetical protein P8174_02840 [Gemmatimonadota bacterium]|jgi:hypothetical protein